MGLHEKEGGGVIVCPLKCMTVMIILEKEPNLTHEPSDDKWLVCLNHKISN